ncbi:hypothetical protein F4780DRAFT_196554 [Xylariomycetidae sp. FL0641]|nr:hypothetical protein F4780DRAFT_196554 [Xylariomycetidae sp. FL0641]
MGRTDRDATPRQIELLLRSEFLNETLYAPVSAAIRIAISVMILRISVRTWHRWTIFTLIGVVATSSIAYFFVILLQCTPPSRFWEQMPGTPGSCLPHQVVPIATLSFGAINIAVDWIVGLLPIAIIWNAPIHWRSKASIAALLSLGILAGVALLIRILFTNMEGSSRFDIAFATTTVAMAAVIELSLGILAACLATMPPLFKSVGTSLRRRQQHRLSSDSDCLPWQAEPTPRIRPIGLTDGRISKLSKYLSMSPEPYDEKPGLRSPEPFTPTMSALTLASTGERISRLSKLSRGPGDSVGDRLDLRSSEPGTPTHGVTLTHCDVDRGSHGSWADPSKKGIEIHTLINVISVPSDETLIFPPMPSYASIDRRDTPVYSRPTSPLTRRP